MHELSIASRVVEIAAEHCRAAGGSAVTVVTLAVGGLACVHEGALRAAFDIARERTPLANAELRIRRVPVRVWCPACLVERELPGIQRLACPACGTATGDIRAGRELDLESVEIVTTAPLPSVTANA